MHHFVDHIHLVLTRFVSIRRSCSTSGRFSTGIDDRLRAGQPSHYSKVDSTQPSALSRIDGRLSLSLYSSNEHSIVSSTLYSPKHATTFYTLTLRISVWFQYPCPVWARELCRISPRRFLAEYRMRRLNQASFVLLYFALFAFFWVVFSFVVCLF